jgi:hypothetical protein
MSDIKQTSATAEALDEGRRSTLRRLGRFAAVTAPTVTLLLAAKTKPAVAAPSTPSSRQFKISAGAVDGAALLSRMSAASSASTNAIDGVGICFAAIKALHGRLDRLEAEVRAATI